MLNKQSHILVFTHSASLWCEEMRVGTKPKQDSWSTIVGWLSKPNRVIEETNKMLITPPLSSREKEIPSRRILQYWWSTTTIHSEERQEMLCRMFIKSSLYHKWCNVQHWLFCMLMKCKNCCDHSFIFHSCCAFRAFETNDTDENGKPERKRKYWNLLRFNNSRQRLEQCVCFYRPRLVLHWSYVTLACLRNQISSPIHFIPSLVPLCNSVVIYSFWMIFF